MASGTRWYPYVRSESVRQSWLLDDGTVMEEPDFEQSASRRRIRLVVSPDTSDWMKDKHAFIGKAAQTAAALNGRKIWMALGTHDGNTLDADRKSNVKTNNFNEELQPHFLDGESSHRRDRETRAAWRFRHKTMPVEAQLEVSVEKKHRYGTDGWQVITKLIYPGTWPEQGLFPYYFVTKQGNQWPELISDADNNLTLNTKLTEWADAHPIDWNEFNFGVQNFDEERQAINAFARVVRKVMDLEEIEIPNLLNITEDGDNLDKQISMLSLSVYRTNATQDLLDILTDYLTGQPVVEQIKEKWQEVSALFRRVGMVIGDPTDTEWWNFVVQGADAAPIEVELGPVEDDDGRDSTRHSVMINLATGTIVVACSKSSSRDETAIQWETSLIKAEMTGQKDRLLAYADQYVSEREDGRVHEMMDAALKRTKSE